MDRHHRGFTIGMVYRAWVLDVLAGWLELLLMIIGCQDGLFPQHGHCWVLLTGGLVTFRRVESPYWIPDPILSGSNSPKHTRHGIYSLMVEKQSKEYKGSEGDPTFAPAKFALHFFVCLKVQG